MASSEKKRGCGAIVLHGLLGAIAGGVVAIVPSIFVPGEWAAVLIGTVALLCGLLAAIQGDKFFGFAKVK